MNEDYKNPWPCQFCHGDAVYAPIALMETKGIAIYFCHLCQTEYSAFMKNRHLTSMSIYIDINGNKYRWTTDRLNEYGWIWIIKKPGIPGVKPNDDIWCVKVFTASKGDAIPNITPDNIYVKLRTILMLL